MQRDFVPKTFEWDEATNTYLGTPKDITDANDHWLACAREIVIASGGQIIGEDKAGFGFTKYTGPDIPKRESVVAQTSTPPANAPATPPPGTMATKKQDPVDPPEVRQANYKKSLNQSLGKLIGPSSDDYVNQANVIMERLLKTPLEGQASLQPDAWGWSKPWLIAEVSKVVLAKCGEGMVDFNVETDRFELSNGDDLPF